MTREAAIKKADKLAGDLILAIKANGGYKYRSMLKLSDTDVDKLCLNCEDHVRDMVVRLTVAELMLKEKPRSFHDRWGEYLDKFKDAKTLLVEQKKTKDRR